MVVVVVGGGGGTRDASQATVRVAHGHIIMQWWLVCTPLCMPLTKK